MRPSQELSALPQSYAIGYVSGALRVSTMPTARTLGPRSHILGWVTGAQQLGHTVHKFIAGDAVRTLDGRTPNTENAVRGGLLKRILADAVRIAGNRVVSYSVKRAFVGTHLDFVYERHGAFQHVGESIARHKRIPWILESNGLFFREARLDRQSSALQRAATRSELGAYRRADWVVCVSELLAHEIGGLTYGNCNTVVIPNGVDTELFAPMDSPEPRTSAQITLGFVGSIVEWQNLDRLIRVVARLRRQGLPLRLVLVGDGPAAQSLRLTAERVCLTSESFIMTGAVPLVAVPALVRSFDICYSGHLPTRAGGMYHSPLKIYEYLSVGKPVTASYHTESLYMQQSVPGIELFDAECDESLADAISRAINHIGVSNDARVRRAWVVKHHSWASRVEALLLKIFGHTQR